jgi:hypothetical protein
MAEGGMPVVRVGLASHIATAWRAWVSSTEQKFRLQAPARSRAHRLRASWPPRH